MNILNNFIAKNLDSVLYEEEKNFKQMTINSLSQT